MTSNRAEGDIDRRIAERLFKGRAGVFVEVGAARPDYLSVSAHFRTLGWRVVAIEPIPEFCELQRAAGNEVLQYACGEEDRDDVDFTVVDSHGSEYEGGQVSYESFSSLGIKPNYRTLGPRFGKGMPAVAQAVSSRPWMAPTICVPKRSAR